jgi:hypothetical protein
MDSAVNHNQYSAKFKFHGDMIGSKREQHVNELKRKNEATKSEAEEQVSDWQDRSPDTGSRLSEGNSRDPQ